MIQQEAVSKNAGPVARPKNPPYVRPANTKVTNYTRSVEINCSAAKAYPFCFSLEGFMTQFPHPVKDYVGPDQWAKDEIASFKYKQLVWTNWKVQFIEAEENVKFCDVMIEGYLKVFEHTHSFKTLGPNRIVYTDSIDFASGLGTFIDRVVGLRVMDSLFSKRHLLLKPALER